MPDIQEHDVTVGEQAIHVYLLGGQGDSAIVFVHGWGSSGRMWFESFHQLRGFGTCIAVDLPGHGRSSRPAFEWYSLDKLVSTVWDSMQVLGLARPVLIGHSLGASVALALAAQQPHAISQLIAVAPIVTGHAIPWARWMVRPAFFGPLRKVASIAWPAAGVVTRHRPSRHIVSILLQPFRVRDLEDLCASDPEASLATAVTATTSDLSGSLPAIRTPSLIVVGTHDLTCPPHEGRLAARLIPGARLVELPTRHHPFAERPELFFPAVSEFLRS
jgi:3-oxoadipate enol-lactonase